MKALKRISCCWMIPALTSSLCLLAQASAQALQFNFSYEKGTSYEQMLGFEIAGNVWSSYLTDDATVNIHIGSSGSLPQNVVGGALPGLQTEQYYDNYYKNLTQDATSWHDRKVVSSGLQNYSNGKRLYYKGRLEQTTRNIYYTSLTNANAKAIGLVNPHSRELDGMIMMSDLKGTGYNWNYDFDRSDSIGSNSLDFVSVAVHEIGHVLGFVSSFDLVDETEQNLTRVC